MEAAFKYIDVDYFHLGMEGTVSARLAVHKKSPNKPSLLGLLYNFVH